MEQIYKLSKTAEEIDRLLAGVESKLDATALQLALNDTKQYVDDRVAMAVAGKTHMQANFAQNVEACTDTSKVYVLPDGYIYAYIYALGQRPAITIDGATGGYYEAGPQWVSNADMCCKWTNVFQVTAGDQLTYTGYAKYGAISVSWYDANNNQIATDQWNDGWSAVTVTVTVPENAAFAQFFSYKDTTSVESVKLDVSWIACQAADTISYKWTNTGHAFVPADYEDRIIELEKNAVSKGGGVLHGKKYVACGDSFTAGAFDSKTEENWSEEYGVYKTYPYWIASRNHMTLVNEAQGGSDFTNISGATNPFSLSRYKAIPMDADYITLMFGLNETAIGNDSAAIGTKDDTNNQTLWGAYNVVLEYLLTNMPYAKIGVILADAWMPENYANAVKEICKYWGIPCLDLKGENVPMGIGGQYTATSSKAKALRNAAFQVSSDNSHPNVKAHEYRSTIIENFLRSL